VSSSVDRLQRPTSGRQALPGCSAYGSSALRREVERVRDAVSGVRNEVLFKAAANIGELVAGDEVDEDTAFTELEEAGLEAGLGLAESRSAIRSGFKRGLRNPRSAPEETERTEFLPTADPLPAETLNLLSSARLLPIEWGLAKDLAHLPRDLAQQTVAEAWDFLRAYGIDIPFVVRISNLVRGLALFRYGTALTPERPFLLRRVVSRFILEVEAA
jgi:hypothetical protein